MPSTNVAEKTMPPLQDWTRSAGRSASVSMRSLAKLSRRRCPWPQLSVDAVFGQIPVDAPFGSPRFCVHGLGAIFRQTSASTRSGRVGVPVTTRGHGVAASQFGFRRPVGEDALFGSHLRRWQLRHSRCGCGSAAVCRQPCLSRQFRRPDFARDPARGVRNVSSGEEGALFVRDGPLPRELGHLLLDDASVGGWSKRE